MRADDLVEHAAEVGRHREVASLVALFAPEARPAAVLLAAAHALSADDEHRVAVAVIGAAVAVLGHRPPELAHRQNDDVFHAVAEVARERRDALAEVAKALRELADRRSLVYVRVPAAGFGERDFEAHLGLDELRDLAQRV